MFIKTNFTFDNVNSEETYGLKVVKMNSGMIRQVFAGSRNLIETEIKNNDEPIFYGVEKKPLTFSLTLAKDGEWTYADKMEIRQWLVHDEYKEFESDDNELIFNVIVIGELVFFNNANDKGYLEIKFRCDSPYGYKPEFSMLYDLSTNVPEGTDYEIINGSNINESYYPIWEIEMINTTGFQILNTTNASEVSMNGLTLGENIQIDGRKKLVSSDSEENRLDKLNNLEFMFLDSGSNNITIIGDVKVTIRCKYPIAL